MRQDDEKAQPWCSLPQPTTIVDMHARHGNIEWSASQLSRPCLPHATPLHISIAYTFKITCSNVEVPERGSASILAQSSEDEPSRQLEQHTDSEVLPQSGATIALVPGVSTPIASLSDVRGVAYVIVKDIHDTRVRDLTAKAIALSCRATATQTLAATATHARRSWEERVERCALPREYVARCLAIPS